MTEAFRVGQETVVGTVRAVNPDGTVRVDLDRRPSALILAGSHEEAITWAIEMGYEPKARRPDGRAAALCSPGSIERLRHGGVHRAREAFFVGKWRSLPVEPLARLWLDLDRFGTPITYVTAPDGELVARKMAWFRWNAPSTHQPTRLHLLRRARGDEDHLPPERGRAELLRRHAEPARRHERLVGALPRWGPPPGACGICAHEAWKMPPGTPDSRRAMLAMAARHLGTLRAQQSGVGHLEDLSRQTTAKGDR